MNPENNEGNIEYKLKLINKSEERLGQLATQMRYRCREGDGECIYNLGVEDCGEMVGITNEEYIETISNINSIADKNDYLVTLLSEMSIDEDKKVYEVLVREKNNDKYIDIKVAIAGNVNAGKSSFLGSLTTGKNDDGRGSARSTICNYAHELKSGRTSSVAHHIIGFDCYGKIVNYRGIKLSWQEIVANSKKVISFYDLAGHEKYIRTTILGLTSSFPDICIIMVAANDGINAMTKEHIFLCVILKIPFIIVISKIDICIDRKNIMEETIRGINRFLKLPGIRRVSLPIRDNDDIRIAVKSIYNEDITPIFYTSNVTGEGLDKVTNFLNLLSPRLKADKLKEDIVEFHIDHVWNVDGFGTVIGGHLLSGKIRSGDKLLMGPGDSGVYENIIIRTIKCKKIPLSEINYGGSYVCLGIKRTEKTKIKKGNVIISNNNDKLAVYKFTGKVDVLKTHSTTVKVGYEPTLHMSNIRQCVKIVDIKNKKNSRSTVIDDNILRNSDSAIITLKFMYRPEYVKPGMHFLLCEGRCKIVGEVIETE